MFWYKDGSHYFLSDNTELRAIRPWERPDSWAGKPWDGWFVGLSRTRDSDVLTESNFYVFLDALRALPEVTVDVGFKIEPLAEQIAVVVLGVRADIDSHGHSQSPPSQAFSTLI